MLPANDPNTDPALNPGLKENVFGGKPGPAVVDTSSLEQPLSTYAMYLLFCSHSLTVYVANAGREEVAKRSAELNKE